MPEAVEHRTLQSGSNPAPGGKVDPTEPVLTSALKERSDARMSRLAGNFIANAPKVQKVVGDNSQNSTTEKKDTTPESSKDKTGVNQPVAPDKVQQPSEAPKKVEEPPKPTEKKAEETPPKETPPAKPKKLSYDELEEARRGHQARADRAEAELAKATEANKTWETERADLLRNKELVDQFTKDPVAFISQRAPELAKRLSVAGDPVKMIESEVGAYHAQLEQAFKKELGEDWRYSEAEGLKPGTPSFKFKLAIESKLGEVRQQVSGYIDSQRRNAELAREREASDRKRLTEEFGFTEEHFKKADQVLQKEGITYYSLVKLALVDEIIKSQIGKVVPPPEAPKDIAETRGANAELDREPAPKLSEAGKRMASRLPIRR
jgi:outer membrane biosynthesis protein TonB